MTEVLWHARSTFSAPGARAIVPVAGRPLVFRAVPTSWAIITVGMSCSWLSPAIAVGGPATLLTGMTPTAPAASAFCAFSRNPHVGAGRGRRAAVDQRDRARGEADQRAAAQRRGGAAVVDENDGSGDARGRRLGMPRRRAGVVRAGRRGRGVDRDPVRLADERHARGLEPQEAPYWSGFASGTSTIESPRQPAVADDALEPTSTRPLDVSGTSGVRCVECPHGSGTNESGSGLAGSLTSKTWMPSCPLGTATSPQNLPPAPAGGVPRADEDVAP